MSIPKRRILTFARAPFEARHYAAILRSHIYLDWQEFFVKRYILRGGTYPFLCRIRTPLGAIGLTLYGTGDAFTVQEIFGLGCYASKDADVVVDFGSNIGISAAYFLSRNPRAKVYCYEPLPENFAKLRNNLRPFEGRFEAQQVAVTDKDGVVSFYTEPSGRLSGFECTEGDWREFPCVSAADTLRRIIEQHGRIDLLKVDVEGSEGLFMQALPADVLRHIRRIYVEGRRQFQLHGFSVNKTLTGVDCYTLSS